MINEWRYAVCRCCGQGGEESASVGGAVSLGHPVGWQVLGHEQNVTEWTVFRMSNELNQQEEYCCHVAKAHDQHEPQQSGGRRFFFVDHPEIEKAKSKIRIDQRNLKPDVLDQVPIVEHASFLSIFSFDF